MPSGDTLPMFGPRLRDASSVLGTSPPPGAQLTLEAIRAKAVEMYDRGELGNQLIAAHQKNPFLRYLLTELVKLDSLSDLERDVKLSEIRQRNVAHITGPNFIDGRLNEYNRAWVKKNDTASYGETRGSARFRPTEATRDLWSELAWVTLESENQETASIHSVQGTEQPPQDTLRRSGTVREKLKRFGGSLTGTFRSSHQDGGNDATVLRDAEVLLQQRLRLLGGGRPLPALARLPAGLPRPPARRRTPCSRARTGARSPTARCTRASR